MCLVLIAGPGAPCWKKGAKDRAGGAGRERDGAWRVQHWGLLQRAGGLPGSGSRCPSQVWCFCRIGTTQQALKVAGMGETFTLKAHCLGKEKEDELLAFKIWRVPSLNICFKLQNACLSCWNETSWRYCSWNTFPWIKTRTESSGKSMGAA